MAHARSETLYGFHPVCEALQAGRRTFETLLLRKGRGDLRADALRQLAEARGIAMKSVDDARLTAMVGHGAHQGVCARVGPLPFQDLPALLTAAGAVPGPPFLVLLDQLQDPHNLGAVIRTGYCAGVGGVVLPQDRAAGPSPAVSKASAGALEHMPLARVPNLVNAMRVLKQHGLWLVGLDGAAAQSLYGCDLTMPLGLIVGGEEKGLRPLVKRHCDYLVKIPHARPFNSLNASVAGALAIYEAFRQRNRDGGYG
jgi:23S rRNA (guanosine2251-2'-O)-methyltransferase